MPNINIRIDEKTKSNAEKVLKDLGITPTAAITMFYRQVIRTNGIPFELISPTPNKETLEALQEVEMMEKGEVESKSFDNIGDLLEDLKE